MISDLVKKECCKKNGIVFPRILLKKESYFFVVNGKNLAVLRLRFLLIEHKRSGKKVAKTKEIFDNTACVVDPSEFICE